MGAKGVGKKRANLIPTYKLRKKAEVKTKSYPAKQGRKSHFKHSETKARMRVYYPTGKTADKMYKNKDTMQDARESYKMKGIKTRRLKKI
jgi:hypothetical protein